MKRFAAHALHTLAVAGFLAGNILISSCTSASGTTTNSTSQDTNRNESINRFARVSPPYYPPYIDSEVFLLKDSSSTPPILMTTGDLRRGEYEVVAIIKCERRIPQGSRDFLELCDALRIEARKLDAHAVIGIQHGSVEIGYHSRPWVVGTAVKFK